MAFHSKIFNILIKNVACIRELAYLENVPDLLVGHHEDLHGGPEHEVNEGQEFNDGIIQQDFRDGTEQ